MNLLQEVLALDQQNQGSANGAGLIDLRNGAEPSSSGGAGQSSSGAQANTIEAPKAGESGSEAQPIEISEDEFE